ncbi:MAG: hypothetical protein IH626_16955, partial [Rhodospirillales bacterium]|nr:hypothetical protein [Rhodospirillales bacterium]
GTPEKRAEQARALVDLIKAAPAAAETLPAQLRQEATRIAKRIEQGHTAESATEDTDKALEGVSDVVLAGGTGDDTLAAQADNAAQAEPESEQRLAAVEKAIADNKYDEEDLERDTQAGMFEGLPGAPARLARSIRRRQLEIDKFDEVEATFKAMAENRARVVPTQDIETRPLRPSAIVGSEVPGDGAGTPAPVDSDTERYAVANRTSEEVGATSPGAIAFLRDHLKADEDLIRQSAPRYGLDPDFVLLYRDVAMGKIKNPAELVERMERLGRFPGMNGVRFALEKIVLYGRDRDPDENVKDLEDSSGFMRYGYRDSLGKTGKFVKAVDIFDNRIGELRKIFQILWKVGGK